MSEETKKSNKVEFQGQEYSPKEIREMFLEAIDKNLKNNDQKESILELAQLACKKAGGSKGGAGRQTNSKSNIIREMILDKKELTEDEVWLSMKWGKHEALSAFWNMRKKGDAADYVWVQFERGEDGVGKYVLKGQGPEAPAGFIVRTAGKKAADENLEGAATV